MNFLNILWRCDKDCRRKICCLNTLYFTASKKLPCNHIFHTSCLRSWFQRQQTCPTCRLNILRTTPPTQPAREPQAGPQDVLANAADARPPQAFQRPMFFFTWPPPVSYTHLDVYKRQLMTGVTIWLKSLTADFLDAGLKLVQRYKKCVVKIMYNVKIWKIMYVCIYCCLLYTSRCV